MTKEIVTHTKKEIIEFFGDKEYLSCRKVCEFFNKGKDTFKRYLDYFEVPSTLIGGYYKYSLQNIMFLNEKLKNYTSRSLTLEMTRKNPNFYLRATKEIITHREKDIEDFFRNEVYLSCNKLSKLFNKDEATFKNYLDYFEVPNTLIGRYYLYHIKDIKILNEKLKNYTSLELQNLIFKKTCLETYGVENTFQAEVFKEKIKKTTQKKYGVDYISQNKEVKEKTKQTCLERYGAESHNQNEKVKEKKRQKYLAKYGVDNPQQNKLIQKNSFNTKKVKLKNKIKESIKLGKEVFTAEYLSKKYDIPITSVYSLTRLLKIPFEVYKGFKLFYNIEKLDKYIEERKGMSIPEIFIQDWLNNLNIENHYNYRFDDCKNIKVLPFDFYLPKYNICIEYDGEQHYRFVEYFHKTIEKFEERQRLDKIKDDYCDKNNIILIRIRYDKNIEEVLDKELKKYII